MKKLAGFAIIVSMLLVCLSSCSSYNKIMREHLSDPDNYHAFEAVLQDMYYQDPLTGEIVRDLDNYQFADYDITITVSFETEEAVTAFLGGSPNPSKPLEEYEFALCIHSDNHQILYANGFYDNVSLGDKLSIKASDWIYMDCNYFYVAQVECGGTEYLHFEDGLENIIDMMGKKQKL